VAVQPWPGPGWDPLGDLLLIKEEMSRLFETLQSQGAGGAQSAEGAWTPPVDVCETKTDLRIQVELPGISVRQIRIEVAEGVLTIRAERPPDPSFRREQIQQIECRHGVFIRRLTLPPLVDPDGIRATCRDGVLEVRLPKRAESQPRQVSIEAA
jgi:HSP20 family protein